MNDDIQWFKTEIKKESAKVIASLIGTLVFCGLTMITSSRLEGLAKNYELIKYLRDHKERF